MDSRSPGGGRMSPPRDRTTRAARKRRERLDEIEKEVANGTLVIRKASAEERASWATAADADEETAP